MQFYWLLEDQAGPFWLSVRSGRLSLTADANDAIKFVSQPHAVRYLEAEIEKAPAWDRVLKRLTVTEHGFDEPTPPSGRGE